MPLPKSLKIWGHDYDVKQRKNPVLYDAKDGVNGVLGFFSGNEQLIVLKKDLDKKPSREAEVLLHEVFHGVAYNSNLFNGIRDHEEHVVDTLANGMILIFKDNPDLLDYFVEALHPKIV